MIPALVGAWTFQNVKAAATTMVTQTSNAVTAGNTIIAAILFDNAATASKPIVSSITKQAGETANWVLLGAARSTSTSAGAFSSAELWCIQTTVNWAAATYTVTFDTSITMKAINGMVFSGVQAVVRSTGGTAYSTTTTAASATTTGTTPQVNDLAVGFIFGSNVAAPQAGDTDTTGGAWTGKNYEVGTTGGSAATNNYGIMHYKVLTAGSHQTLNNSATMTAGNGSIVAILQSIPEPAITQAAYQFFDDAGTESGAAALAAQNTAVTGNLSNGDGYGQIRVRLQSTTAQAVPATDDFMLQWEKNASGTWNNAIGTQVAASYDESNRDGTQTFGSSIGPGQGWAVSFLGNGQPLLRVGFMLQKVGAGAGNISAALWTHSGTYGSGVPTGSAASNLQASTTVIAASSLSTTIGWVYFDFPGTYTLANGTPYFIGVVTSVGAGDNANHEQIGNDGSTPSWPGNSQYLNGFGGSTWGSTTSDIIFSVTTGGGTAAVIEYDSPTLTESAATTNRLTGGTGTFVPGKVSEIGHVTNVGWGGNNYTEILYSVKLIAAQLANGDILRFRVLRNGSTATMTYSVTPTINIVAGINEKDRPVAITAAVAVTDTYTPVPVNYSETNRSVPIAAAVASVDQADFKEITLPLPVVAIVVATDKVKYVETNRYVDITAIIASTDRAGRKELSLAVAVASVITSLDQADFKEVGAVAIVSAVTATDVLVGGTVNYDETGRAVAVVASVASTDLVKGQEPVLLDPVVSVFMVTDRVAGTELLGGALHDLVFEVMDFFDPAPTVVQEGFRWRNDDGNQTAATWLAAQDTNASVALDTPVRLRVLLDAEGDPDPLPFTLYYKKTTDSTWLPVPVRTMGLSASGRNLYEGDQPFYGFVDTPWHLACRCTQDEIIGYVATRKAQGFNMLQIVALNIYPDVEPVNTKQNIYGKFPFTGNETPDITSPIITGAATNDDGSADYDYWDHIRWTVEYIGKQGMYVNIVPMWHGYQGSSWRGYLDATKATTYGTFIGTLLGGFPHVMWMLGGDNNPVGNTAQVPGGLSTADVVTPTNNMAAAITAQCVRPPLMTFHCDRLSSPTTWFWGQSWYNVYGAYSDRWTWDYVENEVDSIPTAPTHMVESYYDGRAAFGLSTPHLTREEVRAEMYWSYLSGAANAAYAHEFTCRMAPDWEDYVNVPSATDIALLRRIIERLGAQPGFDTRTSTNAMLATGRGDGAVNVASVAGSAVSKDRTYGVAYFLETRTPISVNLARFNKTSVALKWVHPGTGAETVIGTYGGTGTQTVTYPGGFTDALLIAEASGSDAVTPLNKSVSDQFDGTSTASWIEHDTDNVGTFTVTGGKLNLAITGTGNYDMSNTLSNAPKWLQLHQGDFDVTVRCDTTVTGSTAPQSFRGWNILAMAGPTGDHAFLSTYDTTTLTQRIDHGRRVGSTITHQYNTTPGGGVPATLVLRLRRVGDVFTAYYGSSPYNVTSLGNQTWTGASAMTHLGVCVVTSGATWSADFEYFNVAGGEPVLGTATADPVYIAPSDNITASGEATTALLTPPAGKTTVDFSTGRVWDDENGTDLVDI